MSTINTHKAKSALDKTDDPESCSRDIEYYRELSRAVQRFGISQPRNETKSSALSDRTIESCPCCGGCLRFGGSATLDSQADMDT